MKFGFCCPAERAAEAIAAGFDYAEIGAADLPEKIGLVQGLAVEATNLFFPGSFRLFDPTVGDYIAHALSVVQAASTLGVEVMVIGSGNQRRSGDSISANDALDRFIEIVAEISEIALKWNIVIAPENLNFEETNVGVDIGSLANALASRNLSFTVDSYHVLREVANPNWQELLPLCPAHVHYANVQRTFPTGDDVDVLNFFRRLKELGYGSRISFEGSLGETSVSAALIQARSLWETT